MERKSNSKEKKDIENGTYISIILSWDILIWWLFYKKNIPYKFDKKQYSDMLTQANILWIEVKTL